MLDIVVAPNKILVEKTKQVVVFDKKLKKTIEQMEKALDATTDPIGVGLAAPQVNIPKRIFIARPTPKAKLLVVINPIIVSESSEKGIPNQINSKKIEARKPQASKKKLLEGCLSIPDIWGNVSRKREVELEYQDIEGKKIKKTFKGFLATIVQHEIDHLNGVLFTKRVIEQKEKLYRSHKNAEGEDEFDEIEL